MVLNKACPEKAIVWIMLWWSVSLEPAPTGVACSVCPGGVTSGHPVNPLLGAKVLPGETDIALPAPLPFILSRTYSSYRTKTPAPVGSLGPGWKMPADIRLQLTTTAEELA
nr:DUF6531 domain-containing protein [Escherichia coli]